MLEKMFFDVNAKLSVLYGELLKSGFSGNQEVYDAAINLYSTVGAFIEELETKDDNLDPEKTKLPNLDELFADDPTTDYVHAAINYAQSEGNEEAKNKLVEAAMNLAAHQGVDAVVVVEQGCVESCCPSCCDCPTECKTEMGIHDHIALIEDDYAARVKENMGLVERELEGKTEFSQSDLYLIRYYLKHLPNNSDYDVEEVNDLSDRGLELAWKRLQYFKNK